MSAGVSVRVTCLHRDEDGVWCAHVSSNGTTLQVDRRYGSWRATAQLAPRVERWEVPREVLPAVAAELQARLPVEERKVAGRTGVAKAPPAQERLGL